MTDNAFLAAEDLPPKPDRETGQPRPPRAPGLLFKQKSEAVEARERVNDPGRAPASPEGEGPVLAWYKSSQRRALRMAAWGVPVFIVGVTLLQGFSVEWMKFWQVWLVVLLFIVGLYYLERKVECAAGAEWLKVGKTWVRLYELVQVKAKHRSNALHLDFEDSAGRWVMVRAQDLQRSRELWDLVYNGVLHSVIAGGAKTNGLVHKVFEVPQPDPRKR